jgi:hypothetical protein
MLTYPVEVIFKAKSYAEGNQLAKRWLEENKFDALVRVVDAVIYDDSKAVEKLLIQKKYILVAFINAAWDDKQALQILLDRKEVIWAAMANILNGDKKALAFLIEHKLKHYADFAIAMLTRIQKTNDKNSTIFNSGPYKAPLK